MMRGVFVTGTDTGVGKTVVAACLVAAARKQGLRVAAFKPVVTGLDEPEPGRPADHELLAAAAGASPAAVTQHTFGPPLSPHLAAQLAGTALDRLALLEQARRAAASADLLVAEGAGGLLVPLTAGDEPYLIRDFAGDLGLPLVIAARPGLGTINHTLLTIEAARAAGLEVRAVVLTPWPSEPSTMELSNRKTIAELGAVDVRVLPVVTSSLAEMAAAGAALADLLALSRAPAPAAA